MPQVRGHSTSKQSLKMTPLTVPSPHDPPDMALSVKGSVKRIRSGCQAAVSALQVSDSQLRCSDMKGLIDHYFNT